VLLDAVYRVTGSQSKFPGVAPGTRAAALPDSGVELPSGFLTTFGRPARESACECERTSGMQLGPVMALVSGPTLGDAIADPANELTRLVGREADDSKLVDDLFVRVLNRAGHPDGDRRLPEGPQDDRRRPPQDGHRAGQERADFALRRPQLERDREAAIVAAQAALAAHEAELAPRLAEQEKQKAEKTAKLEAELKAHEAGLPAKIAAWEKAQSPIARWQTLTPGTVSDTTARPSRRFPTARCSSRARTTAA